MEGRNKAEDFDDFFDTPGRSVHDGGLPDDSQTGIHTATPSHYDRYHRKSVSSETDGSISESLTENAKEKRNRSPFESDLSRSEGESTTRNSSRSCKKSHRERRKSKQSEKERLSSSNSRSTSPRDSLSGRRSRRERKDSNKSKAEENKLGSPSSSKGENFSSGDSRSSKNVRRERSEAKSKAEEELRSCDSPWSENLSSDSSRDSRSGKNSYREKGRSCLGKPTSSIHGGKYENKSKKRGESSSSVTSNSYSDDSDNSGRERCFTTNKVAEVKHQAWVKDSGDSSAHMHSLERPKTAKRVCGSDSDMTDVSPMSSPRDGSLNGHGENTSHSTYKHESKSVHFKKYKAVSLSEETAAHRDYAGNGNAIDLNILMKAVSEIEKEKRVKAQTRRVMFEPVQAKSYGKTNYTFSCDDTDRIEKENKRLLQEIMKCMHSNSEKRESKMADPSIKRSTLTASAINRRRDQKRIENDNLAFLKRLQSVRPSKGISRQEQLHAYNSTVLHGVPISVLHPAPSYRTQRSDHSSNFSVADSLGHRTYSQNSLQSTASPSVSSTTSQQSSRAGSRPTSAKMAVRPPWSERW